MTTTKQPEALRLADQIEAYANAHPMSYPVCNIYAAGKLRRQHARIVELEAQLSAIGAGGVEPLRKQIHADTENLRDALSAAAGLLGVFVRPGDAIGNSVLKMAAAALNNNAETQEKTHVTG